LTGSELEALLALQDFDTGIDQRRHRRAHLPERAELTAVDREAAELAATTAEATAARDEIAGRQAAVEADLATTEERIASVNRRLYGGEVRASRDLQALAADVETLKGRASSLEDEVLELMELREPFEKRIGTVAARIAALAERRLVTAGSLAVSEATLDTELDRLATQRADAAASVPAELLGTYDGLRARLDGVAVARLVGNHCDGCHLTLPSMELDRIRHLAEREVVTCDQCGRILVRS